MSFMIYDVHNHLYKCILEINCESFLSLIEHKNNYFSFVYKNKICLFHNLQNFNVKRYFQYLFWIKISRICPSIILTTVLLSGTKYLLNGYNCPVKYILMLWQYIVTLLKKLSLLSENIFFNQIAKWARFQFYHPIIKATLVSLLSHISITHTIRIKYLMWSNSSACLNVKAN
jgi:hypothetical protein